MKSEMQINENKMLLVFKNVNFGYILLVFFVFLCFLLNIFFLITH